MYTDVLAAENDSGFRTDRQREYVRSRGAVTGENKMVFRGRRQFLVFRPDLNGVGINRQFYNRMWTFLNSNNYYGGKVAFDGVRERAFVNPDRNNNDYYNYRRT